MSSLHELFGGPIHSYTRKQAIEDGILVDVTTPFPSDTRMYKYPVAITREIWEVIEGKHAAVWVWDICYMSIKYVIAQPDESTVVFLVNLPVKKGAERTKTYKLISKCHPGDNWEPVITIMLSNQD